MLRQLTVSTRRRRELIDITQQVRELVADAGVDQAICLVASVHTTAAITLNENADPAVSDDLLRAFEDVIGDEARFVHAEGNSGAHALTSLVGASVLVPVAGGRLVLGTWQAIYLCEFDGPRSRTVVIQLVA
ncbi:MAG: YjbQ family protein [Chloroflexi bacterium]|nr:YjbQ family protein [Chloroflexota bacterium]